MISAIELVAKNVHLVRAGGTFTSENLPSPCISVCRMDAATGWCEGCFRTLDEIAAWSRTDAAGKRQVWELIGQRLEQATSTSSGQA